VCEGRLAELEFLYRDRESIRSGMGWCVPCCGVVWCGVVCGTVWCVCVVRCGYVPTSWLAG
jgi:hypothetical protein